MIVSLSLAAPAAATTLDDDEAFASAEHVEPCVPYATRIAALHTHLDGPSLDPEPGLAHEAPRCRP